jgi:hypothetical protein
MKSAVIASAMFALVASMTLSMSSKSEEDTRPVLLYCKEANFKIEGSAYVCDFGRTESQGCIGWQHSRVERRDVRKLDHNYKQCEGSAHPGKWLVRLEMK